MPERHPAAVRNPASTIAEALDRATYGGYVAGFTAARDRAAALAEAEGAAALAERIRALAPLPDRSRRAPGRA
ncbi:MAG: hypothetical protein NZ523_14255 [Elioraea sp.]|nr:hypothetical protein [Elioraea sp.]